MTCFLWTQKTRLALRDGRRLQESPVSVSNNKIFKEQVKGTTMTYSEMEGGSYNLEGYLAKEY